MKKKLMLLIAVLMLSFYMTAQVKVGANPTTINTNSVLELESTTKGLLLPRVTLSSTSSFSPLTAHVAGMSVYNTATAGAGITGVTPGYYYNDGTQWVPMLNQSIATATEPWYDAATNTPATTNAQNIYHAGNVGVGLTSTTTFVPSATLDINGNARVRSLPTGANTDLLVSADTNGNLRTLAVAKPSVLVIGLTGSITVPRGGNGGSYNFPNGAVLVNTILGSTFTPSTSSITLPAGTYTITLVYEASIPNSTAQFVNSYFYDFPATSGSQRIHNNSPTFSQVHGGSINYTTTLNATRSFNFNIGWGQGGNVTVGTSVLFSQGVQLYIQRLL
ncbi:hypothetical protein QWY99_08065 [Flavobacterium branchiarum]|uniref:C1q domain-containing protein n=1 Tax=Flavobacterium branchiarum TaxID=1114870 RepID=A0ABV5FIW9_9FLAO|nr:hypothetical protein [Flavobacterium branchiarum]MDN3673004.1 hypothetical protein [Flavobacterium branchiarum]